VSADDEDIPRQINVPPAVIATALRLPPTSHLVVTHCGLGITPPGHGLVRPSGVAEAIVGVCVGGASWIEVRGRRHLAGLGDLLLVPPAEPHIFETCSDDAWRLWWMHVTGPDLAELIGVDPRPVRRLSEPYRAVALIRETFDALERDATGEDMLAASGAAWHLLAWLRTSSEDPQQPSAIDRVHDHIREHFASPLPISSLAGVAHLSASHLAVLFRNRYGMAIREYQTRLRMARARELLLSTDLPVADIGRSVGYDDASYFGRRFVAEHGVTPRRYRTQNLRFAAGPLD
jgi:AraC-like DNA-binding protein